MTNFLWVIAIIVLQAVIAALAKKADAKAKAAKAAKLAESQGFAGSSAPRTASTPPRPPLAAGEFRASDEVGPQARARLDALNAIRATEGLPPSTGPGDLTGAGASSGLSQARDAARSEASARAQQARESRARERSGERAREQSRERFGERPAKKSAQKSAQKSQQKPLQKSRAAQPERRLDGDSPASRRPTEASGPSTSQGFEHRSLSAPAAGSGRPEGAQAEAARAALRAADLRTALRNPADIRKALILGEILGAPRSVRPF